MRTPFFIESPPRSLIRVEHADVAFAEFGLDARGFLPGLHPTSHHTNREKNRDVRSGQRWPRQHHADPMSDDGPSRRCVWRCRPFGFFNAMPNGFLKARRERSI